MERTSGLRDLTNEQLLECYQRAESTAFDEFYRRNHLVVFNFLLYRLANHQWAEDALQETFIKIHKAILTYDSGRSAMAWVMGIAKNVAIDMIRKRSRTLNPNELDTVQGARAEARLAARQSLEEIMTSLTPTEQQLLVSRFVNDESYEEIAARSGATMAALRKRFSRLMQKITVHSPSD